MPLVPRLFPGDVELGKRDDDHRPGERSSHAGAWQYRRPPIRRNMKRIFGGLIGLIAIYYFIKNIPTDLGPVTQRPSYQHQGGGVVGSPGQRLQGPATGQSSVDVQGAIQGESGPSQHYFNGPIKFYRLSSSLHAISGMEGSKVVNRNVLFAASSLKSASALLPLACEMGRWGRNHVHFALMGRDDIAMDILRAVNGVDDKCHITFHGKFIHGMTRW